MRHYLQEVKLILEATRRDAVQKLADQNRKLPRVLIDSRNTDTAAPVVVEMRLLVSEQLNLVSAQAAGVVNDVVACRRDCSLANGLADQEEVVAGRGIVVIIEKPARMSNNYRSGSVTVSAIVKLSEKAFDKDFT